MSENNNNNNDTAPPSPSTSENIEVSNVPPAKETICEDCKIAGGLYLKKARCITNKGELLERTVYRCPGIGKFHTPESRQPWIVPSWE